VRLEHLPTRVVVSTGSGDAHRLGEVSRLGPDALVPTPLDAAGLTAVCRLARSFGGLGAPLEQGGFRRRSGRARAGVRGGRRPVRR
jgi:hypothetical protein